MADPPSQEEVQRVHDWECQLRGHNYTLVQTFGGEDSFICTHCGKQWDLVLRIGE